MVPIYYGSHWFSLDHCHLANCRYDGTGCSHRLNLWLNTIGPQKVARLTGLVGLSECWIPVYPPDLDFWNILIIVRRTRSSRICLQWFSDWRFTEETVTWIRSKTLEILRSEVCEGWDGHTLLRIMKALRTAGTNIRAHFLPEAHRNLSVVVMGTGKVEFTRDGVNPKVHERVTHEFEEKDSAIINYAMGRLAWLS